jgi:hypothetical protein
MITMIRIIEAPLTDGSYVYGVRLSHGSIFLDFKAVTKRDAEALALTLRDAIDRHTNDTAAIRS